MQLKSGFQIFGLACNGLFLCSTVYRLWIYEPRYLPLLTISLEILRALAYGYVDVRSLAPMRLS